MKSYRLACRLALALPTVNSAKQQTFSTILSSAKQTVPPEIPVPLATPPKPEMSLEELVPLLGKCCGCGSKLQVSNSCRPGFLPDHLVSAITNEVTSASDIGLSQTTAAAEAMHSLTCMRCHQLSFNGQAKGDMQNVVADDFRYMLKSRLLAQNVSKSIVVKIVDLLDFQSSIVSDFKNIIGSEMPLIVVANKFDLLPKGATVARVTQWVRHQISSLHVKLHSVHVVSALKGDGIDQFAAAARDFAVRDKRNVFVLGTTNSGKSTLINQLLAAGFIKGVKRGSRRKLIACDTGKVVTRNIPISVTSSSVAGTTLNLIPFKIRGPVSHDRLQLFDTPGICRNKKLHEHLDREDIMSLANPARVVPESYRLQSGQSILLGGLGRLDHVQGRPFLFTVYTSRTVSVHICKTINLPRVFSTPCGQVLSPPSKKDTAMPLRPDDTPCLKLTQIEGHGWDKSCCDIVFDGIGWIALTGSLSIDIRAYSCTQVHTRSSLMPFDGSQRRTKKFYG